jgi:UDPglucose--hexose-1-phosphate uridylyltransferase
VIIATDRLRRPSDFPRRLAPAPARPCALCPGHEDETPPEVLAYREDVSAAPDTPGWRVRVVPNKFPALRIEGDLDRRGEGIYDLMNGVGAHEVVVESPDHGQGLERLPATALEEVLRAYRDRIADLKREERLRSVLVFKNHGAEAGATLDHAHSQLIATPVVPLIVADEIHQSRAYHGYRERCSSATSSARRRSSASASSRRAAAWSRSPHSPLAYRSRRGAARPHAAAFEHIADDLLHDLAAVLGAVLGRMRCALDDPPYNLVLHSAPLGVGESPSYHWHFELLPKLTGLAGFELGSGFHINPVPPEDAARLLRETTPV